MKKKRFLATLVISACFIALFIHNNKRAENKISDTSIKRGITTNRQEQTDEFLERVKSIGTRFPGKDAPQEYNRKFLNDPNYKSQVLRHVAIQQFLDSDVALTAEGIAIKRLIERFKLTPSSVSEAYSGAYFSSQIWEKIQEEETAKGRESASLRQLHENIQFETRTNLEYQNGPIPKEFFDSLFNIAPKTPLSQKSWSLSDGETLIADATRTPENLPPFTPSETATASELGFNQIDKIHKGRIAPIDRKRFEVDPRYHEMVRQFQLSKHYEFSKSHAGWLETAQLLRDYGIPEYALEHLTPIAYGDTRMIADQLNNAGRFTQTAEDLSAILNSKGVEPGDQIGGLHVFFDQLASASDELYRKRFEIESGITDPEFYQKLRSIPIDFSSGPASLKHIMDREFTGGDWFPYTEE